MNEPLEAILRDPENYETYIWFYRIPGETVDDNWAFHFSYLMDGEITEDVLYPTYIALHPGGWFILTEEGPHWVELL